MTSDRELSTGLQPPNSDLQQSPIKDWQLATGNCRLKTSNCNWQLATGDWQLATGNYN
jgi:hypothetical protein